MTAPSEGPDYIGTNRPLDDADDLLVDDQPDAAATSAADPATAPSPVLMDEDDYQFPVLSTMLATYFATGKELQFLERYERYGESTIEFAGLADDLASAIRSPKKAAAEVNAVLGTDLDAATMREQLIELHEQITSTGNFSAEAIEQAVEEEEAKKPSPEAMLDYYAKRKMHLPAWTGPLSRYEFPLWSVLVAGFLLAALGLGIGNLPIPSWLEWIPATLLAISLVMIGFSAVAMQLLRNEVRNPEKEKEKEKARQEAAEKRAERGTKVSRFFT